MGQETSVGVLKHAAQSGKLGHAYLLYGPRGSGKTTTARLLAKLLNCEARATDEVFRAQGEPCNACSACGEIESGNAIDVVEIDAASNRGIDEIRNLKESIVSSPVKARMKIYIIDEVHMLTTPAFNALLKTLEEPPRHAALILATTEYEKLPATITSRTQRFAFKKLSRIEIAKKLGHIAKAEEITIDTDALELIAAIAEGSVRDAESLLEQLASGSSSLSLLSVEELTGRIGFRKIKALAESIVRRDLSHSLALLMELHHEGANLTQCASDLIHYLRKVLVLALDSNLKGTLSGDHTNEELQEIEMLARTTDVAFLSELLRRLIRAYSEMRYSPFALIPLEIALAEHLGAKEK